MTCAHVRTLEISEDVQKACRDMIERRCREQATILQETWREQSVDAYWQWVNWCFRDAIQDLVPRLSQRSEAWDSPLLERVRM